MIILTETTDNLQIVLGGTVTANQLSCVSSWRDITASAYTPGRTVIATNNTTDVNIVAAPASSTQRVVDFISVYNRDTVTAIVTIKFDANGTEYPIWIGSLYTGERLEYTNDGGFAVYTAAGQRKVQEATFLPASTDLNLVVLGSDVTNNNAVANTIADVTGLSFAVTSGNTYCFEFLIAYTAAATTTGSRWSINGPGSPTLLNYTSEYTLTATSKTVNGATAYDIPAASNASSLTAGNLCTMWGIIKPSSDGTVIARFASEVANSAIVAKAGSFLRWRELA